MNTTRQWRRALSEAGYKRMATQRNSQFLGSRIRGGFLSAVHLLLAVFDSHCWLVAGHYYPVFLGVPLALITRLCDADGCAEAAAVGPSLEYADYSS